MSYCTSPRFSAAANPSTLQQLMHQTLFNRYSSIAVIVSLSLLASLACAASRDAHRSPVGEAIPTKAHAASVLTQQTTASSTPQTLAPRETSAQITGKTASSTVAGARNDS